MPSKLAKKDASNIVVTHEIHWTEFGGKDPETGQEFGDRMRVHLSWDETLERMRADNPAREVKCIRAETDLSKPFTEQRKVTHCLTANLNNAVDWCEKGMKGAAFDTSGVVDAFQREIDGKTVKVDSGNTDVLLELVRSLKDDNAKLAERLEAIEQGSKGTTPRRGGK